MSALGGAAPKIETLSHLTYLHRLPALPKPSHMHKTAKNAITSKSHNKIKILHILTSIPDH